MHERRRHHDNPGGDPETTPAGNTPEEARQPSQGNCQSTWSPTKSRRSPWHRTTPGPNCCCWSSGGPVSASLRRLRSRLLTSHSMPRPRYCGCAPARATGPGSYRYTASCRTRCASALAYGNISQGKLVDVHPSTAWRWVRAAVRRAEEQGAIVPGRKIGTHTLRRSYACHLLTNGIQFNYLSRWLGHSSMQTTLIYLELTPDPSGNLDRVP